MTNFVRADFAGTSIVSYQGKFIARFRNGGRASFLTFLVKHFTVEEYQAALDSGKAPLSVLNAKGYLSPNQRKFAALQSV